MNFPGITTHVTPVSGTDVTAFLVVHDSEPTNWLYTLRTDSETIATGSVDVGDAPYEIKPGQIARIAFLLKVEYAG